MLPILLIIVAIAAAAAGGGGGGGGGGGSSSSAPSSPSSSIPPANSFVVVSQTNDESWIVSEAEANVYRTSEYNNQWGLEAIHAAEAYAVLDKNEKTIAGNGVKIAITDTGAQTNHADLSANISADDNYNYVANSTNVLDTDGHGTHVASIAAGVAGNGGIHGVAYDSQIVVAKSLPGFVSNGIEAIEGSSAIDGVKVINASWTYGSYTSYDGANSGASVTDLAVIEALEVAKDADILVVVAAGNDGDNYSDGQDVDQDANYVANPKPGKPALFSNNSNLAGYVLAVGAVDSDGRIADFSNICGVAKDYCLVAPGVSITGAYPTSGYATGSGTSQASPHVSGAAAVLSAAWPHLTATQISTILLTSASDFGDVGVDATYGKGMLNLYAATQVQGSDSLAFGASLDTKGYSAGSSSIISDPIFGDALIKNLAPEIKNAIFFDDFDRDYKAFLNNKITLKSNSFNALTGVNNILLNDFQEKNIPLNFAQTKTKVNLKIKSYNKNRLKFLTIDNSQKDAVLQAQNGFSFTQNLTNKTSFSFAFNLDEARNQNNDLQEFSFYSFSSLNSNPYQSFINNASSDNQSQKNFNQFLISNEISKKIKLDFSYQNSYQNDIIALQSSKKENQISNLNLFFSPNKNSNFLVSFGKVDEFNDNFLNSKTSGAFENSSNVKTSYVKFASSVNLFDEVFAIASFSQGFTKASGNQVGIFRDFSNIKSRSQSVGILSKNFFGANFGVIYHEPLRVYKGRATIDIPIARDINGNIARYRSEISLKPQGKEQNLEIFLAKNLSEYSQIRLNLLSIKDAGNIKSDKNQYVGIANYFLRF